MAATIIATDLSLGALRSGRGSVSSHRRPPGWDNVNSWSGRKHKVTKTWLPDAIARPPKSARAPRARSRLRDALLWSLKFAENLSFRSASVATHTHTSSTAL